MMTRPQLGFFAGLILVLFSANVELHAATISGANIYPSDNPWNRDISGDPVHPNSANYISNILSGSNKYLKADFAASSSYGIPFNVVSGTQAKVPITIVDYPSESNPGPYPIPSNPLIEAGTDHHLLVLDKDNDLLYEMFNASYSGGWRCSSAAIFDLKTNALRPDGWTSADASGLPILPGLVRYDEVASGAITHALRFTVHAAQNKYIHPATHPGTSTNTNDPPMGLRLRLKASYDISGYTGQAKVILTALKKYGMYVADRGTDWYVTGAPDYRWNDTDLKQLLKVPGSAFEAVQTVTGPVPSPSPAPAPNVGTGTGLTGAYFNNSDFTAPVMTRTDATINFDWGYGAPTSSMGADTFSVRWTGQVQAQYSETYRFYTQSDDGVRLWVNGQQLINDWNSHAVTTNSGTITLVAGQKYDIKVEYFEDTSTASMKLLWSSPSTPQAIIPQTQLYPASGGTKATTGSGTGLSAIYYDNIDFTGATVTRVDPNVNFDWAYNSPASGISADTFSVRWTGDVEAQYSETYTFYTQSDDGVRLWVNGQQVINNWTDHGLTENSGSISLTAGQRYAIRLEFYDGYGAATCKLLWSSASTPKAAVPQSQLYPSSTTTNVAGSGVNATYYDGLAFSGTTFSRIDPTINFDWGSNAPISGFGADAFCVRWTGQIQANFSEVYTFYMQSDDGARVWINNQLVIDRWVDQSLSEASGTIPLAAGSRYSIKVEYYDNYGSAVAKLLWSSPSTPKAIVPQSNLFPTSTATIELAANEASGDSAPEGDSDGDGFSDELEVALGTSPTDPASTPFNGAPAGSIQHLNIKSLDLKLGLENNDVAKLSADVPLNGFTSLAGMQLVVDIGGNATTFNLDAHGKGSNATGKLKLLMPRQAGMPARLSAELSGDLAKALADEGLTSAPEARAESRQVRVTVLLNNTVYQTDRGLLFSAHNGRVRAKSK